MTLDELIEELTRIRAQRGHGLVAVDVRAFSYAYGGEPVEVEGGLNEIDTTSSARIVLTQ